VRSFRTCIVAADCGNFRISLLCVPSKSQSPPIPPPQDNSTQHKQQYDSEQQVPCGTLQERNTLHYFTSWGDVALIVATKRQYFKAIFVLGFFRQFVLLFNFIYFLSGKYIEISGVSSNVWGCVVLLMAGYIAFGFGSDVPCGIST
jgi:hypothetical protein